MLFRLWMIEWLHDKCIELFSDEKIAESIYRYLCEGIDDYDAVESERKEGKWIWEDNENRFGWTCSECGYGIRGDRAKTNFCPNCGAEMKGGDENE